MSDSTQHTPISASQAAEILERIKTMRSGDMHLTVRKFNPGGLTAHQTVDVTHMGAGIDWEGHQVVITTARPLTELTPEDVAAIRESVSKGQSWHAYQSWKKIRDEVDALKAQRDELLAGLQMAYIAMQHMGNVLNNIDAVDEEEDAQHDAAFEAVAALIAKHKGASHG